MQVKLIGDVKEIKTKAAVREKPRFNSKAREDGEYGTGEPAITFGQLTHKQAHSGNASTLGDLHCGTCVVRK